MIRLRLFLLLSILLGIVNGVIAAAPDRPNILVAIADDVSWRHISATGFRGVRTPAVDRLAAAGVRFEHAFCSAPACAPSRASLLTGRPCWQNGEAGCHFAGFPSELTTYPELLAKAGYHVGMTGKGWGPGDWRLAGWKHNPAGAEFTDKKLAAPVGMSSNDYAANFADFLEQRPVDAPFCFWFGAYEAHRDFGPELRSTHPRNPENVEVLPYWPDTPAMRHDLNDYYREIEWFDEHLSRMLEQLSRAGMLDNTIVVVTADNGMPFPRCKSNLYDYGARVPLVVAWPKRIRSERVVTDFTTLADLAPTFVEAAGLKVPAEMTVKSLLLLLLSEKSGRVEPQRDHVIMAKERHAWCQPEGKIAPMRALRTDQFLYVTNLRPELWPNGDPDPQFNYALEPFGDVDGDAGKVTAKYLLMSLRHGPQHRLWESAFAPRPAEELYDLSHDPYQTQNLADSPEYEAVCREYRERLTSVLRDSGDPRYTGHPEIFDQSPYYASQGLQSAGMTPTKFQALSPAERERALDDARKRATVWPVNGDLTAAIAARLTSSTTSANLIAQQSRSDEYVYLAVGHGGHRMTSHDGWTWENHVDWGKPGHDQNDLNVAANFQGAFFVGGGYSYARLTATRDGKTWSEGRIPGGSPLFGLEVVGNELFAIGLRGDVHKTRDGEQWQLVGRADMPTKTHWIRGTAYGNGLIVGSGDYGPALVCDPKTGTITGTQMAGQTDKNATWHRVAFGNGRFVGGGQAGLLATTRDGRTWENNQAVPERGDVYCVEWTGREFVAITSNGAFLSADGLAWKANDTKWPRQIRRVGDWLYGYGWPPNKFSRSTDGAGWEPVPNPREWQAKAFAVGPLAGGPPPVIPANAARTDMK